MDQNHRDVDVVVAGGGPAGLATACLIAEGGHRVILLASPEPRQADPRTVALDAAGNRASAGGRRLAGEPCRGIGAIDEPAHRR